MARLVKREKSKEPKFFKDLKNGQIGEVIAVDARGDQSTIGWLVVKVYDRDIVQVLGYGEQYGEGTSWTDLQLNDSYEIRILEKGELIEV